MVARPRPNESHHYESFWRDLAHGSIKVDVCDVCEVPLPFGTLICRVHGLNSVSLREIGRTGKLITTTRLERHPHPLLDLETPYYLGVVREDRFGVMIYCRVEGDPTNQSDLVEIATEKFSEDVTLIVARRQSQNTL